MKKLLLLLPLLMGCSSTNKLVKTYENVSYLIKYETHTYDVILEVDEETLEIKKRDTIRFEDVYYIPKNIDKYYLDNEYVIYEHTKSLYIYD